MTVQQPPKVEKLSIASSAAITGAFQLNYWVGGAVIVPSAWTDANIGFKVCDTESGTYVIACDETGVPHQISGITTNASKAYDIPVEMFRYHWVKLWSKSTTAATITDTNQDAARALTVVMK